MKRTLTALIATLALGAGSALAGNPNPTESQDAYWDLKDQAAAWNAWREAEQAKATARKAAKPAPQQPAPQRAAQGASRG
jgi:hypothetical protein